MLYHNTLTNFYKTNFSMMQHHKYSLSEIENMMPFERDIYIQMLVQHLQEIEEAKKRQQT